MEQSARLVGRLLRDGQIVYGVTTGFGRLADVRIDPAQRRRLQRNLIVSHAAGVGPLCTRAEVRGMMLLRLNMLAMGHSGVRVALAKRLIEFLNADLCPVVPRRGSVGASGDLAPMAHVALAMIGEGEVELAGRRTTARRAHARLGIGPLTLEAKEGLALINGVQASTALLALSVSSLSKLLESADYICAMTSLAVAGSRSAFDPRHATVRGHKGQAASSQRILAVLEKSGRPRSAGGRVQDPYSIRCAPQVHGVVHDALTAATAACEVEMNAATDNPLVFATDGDILSGGNFHGAPIGHLADHLSIAVTDLASISERRIALLMDPQITGATRFLGPTRGEGLHSGLMMWQVTAAALVSEMKTLAHPASVDNIPTSLGQEDHVSMSMWATDKLGQILERLRIVLAIEAIAGWRAAQLTNRVPRSGPLAVLTRSVDRLHPHSLDDTFLGPLIGLVSAELESWATKAPSRL